MNIAGDKPTPERVLDVYRRINQLLNPSMRLTSPLLIISPDNKPEDEYLCLLTKWQPLTWVSNREDEYILPATQLIFKLGSCWGSFKVALIMTKLLDSEKVKKLKATPRADETILPVII